jgi:membrane-associated phospholipid phosphatase
MKKLAGTVFLMVLLAFQPGALAEGNRQTIGRTVRAVLHDYRSFYSIKNMRDLALGIGVGGVLANTSIDGEIQGWVQGSLRNEGTDDLSESIKLLGKGAVTIPFYGLAALAGEVTEPNGWGSAAGEWGKRSLRAILVGAPPAIFLQNAIGASRPDEDDSRWRPFEDANGVSGHSFMGAIPFIAAAQMAEDPSIRYSLYVGSMLCGWSRINDDRHYLSQAALGWWIAYLSVSCDERAEKREKDLIIRPHPLAGGMGVIAMLSF